MNTCLIFIRHAQSIWNAEKRWQGHANPPLADSGREQARLLAQRMSTWKIDSLYTSDLLRAAETAQILGDALGIQSKEDPIWRERGLGPVEGLTTDEIAEQFPEAWASRKNGPIIGIPGSEPQEAVMARAAAGSSKLLTLHPGQTVAVVSHGGMILTTLVNLLGLPPSGHGLFTVGGNTSISRVVIVDGQPRLRGLNDVAHLELQMA